MYPLLHPGQVVELDTMASIPPLLLLLTPHTGYSHQGHQVLLLLLLLLPILLLLLLFLLSYSTLRILLHLLLLILLAPQTVYSHQGHQVHSPIFQHLSSPILFLTNLTYAPLGEGQQAGARLPAV